MDVAQIREKIIGAWELRHCFLSPAESGSSSPDAPGVVFPWGRDGPGSLMYSAEGWMSSLLQKPVSALPMYTFADDGRGGRTITGLDGEMVEVAKGTQGYVGKWRVEEGSFARVAERDEKHGKIRFEVCRFTMYHDVEMAMPPNWIGEKHKRYFELWEEDGEGGEGRRCCAEVTTDFPAVVGGKEYVIYVGWKKRVRKE